MTNATTFLRQLALLLAAGLTGCAATTPTPATCPDPPDAAAAAAPKAAPGPNLEGTLLEHIPASAVFALVVRPSSYDALTQWLDSQVEMKAALERYLKQQGQMNALDVRGFLLFGDGYSEQAGVASLLLMEPAKEAPAPLEGTAGFTHHGVQTVDLGDSMFMAALPQGAVIGSAAGVKLAIDRALQKVPALSAKDPLGILVKVDTPKAEVLLAADITAMPDLPPMVRQLGLERGAVTLDRDQLLSVYAAGPPVRLEAARAAFAVGAEQALQTMHAQMTATTGGDDTGRALGAIIGFHMLKDALREVEPRTAGGMLVSQYQIPTISTGTAGFVAIGGVLAAIAIPSFIKYLRKSKTVEASEGLDKIAAGAKLYYAAQNTRRKGKRRAPSFPPGTTGWTPATSCCQGGGNTCQPDPTAWNQGPWKDLQFQLSDPHYYQWRYTSTGTGKQATFEAEARGDLDCDGTFSSFKILGAVDASGQVVLQGPIITNEIE